MRTRGHVDDGNLVLKEPLEQGLGGISLAILLQVTSVLDRTAMSGLWMDGNQLTAAPPARA
jgi:hypothetical protein